MYLVDVVCDLCKKKIAKAKLPYRPEPKNDMSLTEIQHYCLECCKRL
jgi:hypothetical protein